MRVRSRSISTKSASLPRSSDPFSPSANSAYAAPAVYAREGLLDGDLLLRNPPVRLLLVDRATRDRRVDAFQRRRRRDEPVAPEGDTRARIEERAEGVRRARALARRSPCRPSVHRRSRGRAACSATTPCVAKRGISPGARCCACSTRNRRSRRAVFLRDAIEDAEDEVDRAVTNGVDHHVKTGPIGARRSTRRGRRACSRASRDRSAHRRTARRTPRCASRASRRRIP